jgi:hypothetical protein
MGAVDATHLPVVPIADAATPRHAMGARLDRLVAPSAPADPHAAPVNRPGLVLCVGGGWRSVAASPIGPMCRLAQLLQELSGRVVLLRGAVVSQVVPHVGRSSVVRIRVRG